MKNYSLLIIGILFLPILNAQTTTYTITQMRTREYIKQLREWDEYGPWVILNETIHQQVYREMYENLTKDKDSSYIAILGLEKPSSPSSRSYIKFFGSKVMVQIEQNNQIYRYYCNSLSYSGTVPSTDGSSTFYKYTGLAKEADGFIGNFVLYTLDERLADIKTGKISHPRIDVRIDYSLVDFGN